ncbi:MAG: Rrf2 family transcriptional regulator [Kiritimatiellia bacterium]
MKSLLKISDAVSIGLHALVLMASRPGDVLSAAGIAGSLGVSRHHLVKVLQRLDRAGLVTSERGPAGGYRTAVDPGAISLLRVIEALEGKVQPAGCLLRRPICGGRCLVGELLEMVNNQLLPYFSSVTIADLADSLKHRSAPVRRKGKTVKGGEF